MVLFKLDPNKPPVEFRFNVLAAQGLEEVAGCSPAMLALRGQSVRALVLMVCFGLLHSDARMTQPKAAKLVQAYLDGGGKIKDLTEVLVDAMNASGVYGEPDVPDLPEDENEEQPPNPQIPAATVETT